MHVPPENVLEALDNRKRTTPGMRLHITASRYNDKVMRVIRLQPTEVVTVL